MLQNFKAENCGRLAAKLQQMISGVPTPSHYSNLFLNVGASRNFWSSKYPPAPGSNIRLYTISEAKVKFVQCCKTSRQGTVVNWPAKLQQMISGVPMRSHYSKIFLNVGASRNFWSSKYPNWAGNLLHW